MRKISEAVAGIVLEDPSFRFCFTGRLLNLTQFASFIKPLVEARTKKEVSTSAIVMSLSRLQRSLGATPAKKRQEAFKIRSIVVREDLVALTVERTRETHRLVNALHTAVSRKGGYITSTESTTEITVVIEKDSLLHAEPLLQTGLVYKNSKISSISIKFDKSYLARPGFLSAVLQELSFQKINVVELASTATEFVIYLERGDVELAFTTLFNRFGSRSS